MEKDKELHQRCSIISSMQNLDQALAQADYRDQGYPLWSSWLEPCHNSTSSPYGNIPPGYIDWRRRSIVDSNR